MNSIIARGPIASELLEDLELRGYDFEELPNGDYRVFPPDDDPAGDRIKHLGCANPRKPFISH